ncbi:MAG: AMP-binding protein [Myxacorys chilensis ATA2-1-KO14]|jgi:nonribosomal peptide synthetase protein BlmVI|nr:AMP-binding protein [Myxacorys chilensis ATA2-1-KO14]
MSINLHENGVIAALLRHAARNQDAIAFRVVDGQGEVTELLTYGQLTRRAGGTAEWITQQTPPMSRIVLALPTGTQFLVGLFGTLMSGRTVVPVLAPRHRSSTRFLSVLNDCTPSLVLVPPDAVNATRAITTVGEIRTLDDDLVAEPCPEFVEPSATAVIQYSSGSTGNPRGVLVRHESIVANSKMISAVFGHDVDSDFVNWLPLFHDMGLIGGVIQPVMLGSTCTLIRPGDFAARPRLWLEVVSRFGAHTSGGPDAAYRLCTQAIEDGAVEGLDLSRWHVAFNGSERVYETTLRNFAARFAPANFSSRAFLPCYGLAEATLLVSGAAWKPDQLAHRFDRAALERGEAVPAAVGIECMALGAPAPGLELAIVKPNQGTSLPPGQIGEIRVRGPSISSGYHGRPPDCIDAWKSTADLGFLYKGILHVLGRLDDVIIQFGRNLFPDDIEAAAGAGSADRGCRMAAVDVEGQLNLVVEVSKRRELNTLQAMASEMSVTVNTTLEAVVDRVVFLRRGTLPRTSSGKIRRSAAAQMLQKGEVDVLAAFTLLGPAGKTIAERVSTFLNFSSTELDRHISLAALGCQSMQALVLRHVLEQDYGLALPADQWLTDLSINEIEALIARQSQFVVATESCIPQPDPRLLVLAQYAAAPDIGALNISFLVHAEGPDVGPRLARATTSVIGLYPALRRAPIADDSIAGGMRTVARAPVQVKVVMNPPEALDAEIRRPFRLEREAPCRATVYDQGDRATLLLVIHHAASDLVSGAILARQLAQSWSGVLVSRGPESPDQIAFIPAAAVGYWQARLTDPPPIFNDSRRLSAGNMISVVVPIPSSALHRRARALRATEFEVCLAAFAQATARVFSRKRLAILTPVSQRKADMEVVGNHVLPVPIFVDDAMSGDFATLISNIRASLRQGTRYGGLPAAVSLTERTAGSLFFDFAFVWQQIPSDATNSLAALTLPSFGACAKFGDLTFERPSFAFTPFHPVEFTLIVEAEGLSGHLVCNAHLVDESTAQQLAEFWIEQLLDAVSLTTIPHIPPTLDEPLCLHRMFERWVRETPDAKAIGFDGMSYSYSQLDSAAKRIAHLCGTPRRVAIICGDGPVGVAAILATLKVGGAFLGLQPSDPPARVQSILNAASPDLILTDVDALTDGGQAVLDDWTASPVIQVSFDPIPVEAESETPSNPEAPAYLVYTSGSSGQPKGMVHTHATLAAFINWQAEPLKISPDARMAVLAPMGFDVRYCELFGALCLGACAVLARRQDLLPETLPLFLAANRVTALQVLPSAFARTPPAALPDVRGIFFVGEPLPIRTAARALGQFGEDVNISNVYGPTETVAASCHRIVPADLRALRIPAGIAIDGRQLYIVGDDLRILECGDIGEIVVETDDVCAAYLAIDPASSDRFLAPGTILGINGRAFRTGDLGTIDSAGRLVVLGRLDNQIKLHGVRFELEEIEAALIEALGVPAAVFVKSGCDGLHIEALLEAQSINTLSLRRHLLERLPAAAIPTAFRAVNSLPKLPNGKMDRSRLEVWMQAQPAIPTSSTRVHSTRVSDAWCAVLGFPPRGLYDNFFAVGGHSLLAMKMVNHLSIDAAKPLQLSEFLWDPTPARLIEMVEAAG